MEVFIIPRKEKRLKTTQKQRKGRIMLFISIIPAILSIITITEKVIIPFIGTIEVTQNKTEPVYNPESLNNSYVIAKPTDIQESNDSYFFLTNVSTLQNNTSKNLIVSDATIEIDDIQPIKEADLEISYGLEDNQLIIFIINNGLGNSKDSEFKLSVILEDIDQVENKLSSKDVENLFLTKTKRKDSLYSGDILKSFELNLSDELHRLFEKNEKYRAIKFELTELASNKKFKIHSIYYDRTNKSFTFSGMGAGGRDKTAVLLLDVSNTSNKYSVPVNKKIAANSTEQINLFIVPNQSSKIIYSVKYSTSNSKYTKATKKIESTITVPLYNTSYSPNGPFFKSLIKNQITRYQHNTNSNLQKEIGYDYKKVLDSH
ncbi:hypothetical protein RV15_GL003560 [Enterococcus silesiacus]|uniref:Uncharacterized protein n=1 Tax=Enterococcus silesiacus TaxID=332949 RepID=A0AA91JPB6_9ENTE|nr:hypothetical protein RV15_GL003560 [Enterococcus silesiacus]